MNKDTLLFLIAFMLFAFALVGAPIVWWYKSSVQSAVYKRQGIEMSTWECMMGAKPAERTINVREPEAKP